MKKNKCLKYGLIILIVLAILFKPQVSYGQTESQNDNLLNVYFPTQMEIVALINSLDGETFNPKYDVKPNIYYPYSAGKLNQSYLQSSTNLINVIRFVAGIPAWVTLDSTYNTYAQTGSLVNAANNVLSHTPTQPSGMSNEMYNTGYTGTTHSNIAFGYSSLGEAIIFGWMSDNDDSNIGCVGHRRWILNPPLKKVGFGHAGIFTSMYAFDTSGNALDFNRVAWPAYNTPNIFFRVNDPWSISMGQQISSAYVKLTLTNTGETWAFGSTGRNDGYFNIDNDYYGQPGCIIFRPKNYTNTKAGMVYQVDISGKYVSGENFTVSYPVEFFDVEHIDDKRIVICDGEQRMIDLLTKKNFKIIPKNPSNISRWESTDESIASVDNNGNVRINRHGYVNICAYDNNDNIKFICTIRALYYDVPNPMTYPGYAVYWAADSNITKGFDNVYFGPGQNCTRREMAIFLWRMAGCPKSDVETIRFNDCGAYNPSMDTYKAIAWAQQTGLIKGYSDGGFHPNGKIVRKDALIMLYRFANKPYATGKITFPDVIKKGYSKTSDTYNSILWASQLEITKGYSDGTFKPNDNCLREHIVTFLYRYNKIYN